VLPLDVANGLLSDLISIENHRAHWMPGGEQHHGMDTPSDEYGRGSVGGLDEHGKAHHHELWKPNQ
jgi:hypothetical protein